MSIPQNDNIAETIQVITTTATKEEAQRIATALVESGLADCVQIVGPVTSVYRWQGKIETSEEWQCHVKTRGALYARVEVAILEVHSYDCPEILVVPIETGAVDYLQWLRVETGAP